ncbi:MAG: hypothetical protein ABI787_11400 [Spartobacteria bacterium]
MPVTFKNGFYVGMLLALFLGIWLMRLWTAENQVRLHSEHFLQKIEKRSWSGAGDFIAADYHDTWGHDRALVLNRLRMTLGFFSSLTITAVNPEVSAESSTGQWSAKIHLAGSGEMAPAIIDRVDRLTAPFSLHWRRESWRPWDWKLVEVRNPSLELTGGIY